MRGRIPDIKYSRTIKGMSAILLPFDTSGEIDWRGMRNHIQRTFECGLTPAVNMDTGYANLIDNQIRLKVLEVCRDISAGLPFVGGCFVGDEPGSNFSQGQYGLAIEQVQRLGGTPIIFQSYGLTGGGDDAIVENYNRIAQLCNRFFAFELGQMFAPFGQIYSLDVYRQLLGIEQCIGAKHSSLSRRAEWDRLLLRDEVRSDFLVLTGNDLAIDMVMYGSDYLLGLSTFAPDLFAIRDRYWADGDPAFYEINDKLQYLGFLAFRHPTSAYKHSAAQFLHLRKWIATSKTHPNSLRRPESDVEILKEIISQLGIEAG